MYQELSDSQPSPFSCLLGSRSAHRRILKVLINYESYSYHPPGPSKTRLELRDRRPPSFVSSLPSAVSFPRLPHPPSQRFSGNDSPRHYQVLCFPMNVCLWRFREPCPSNAAQNCDKEKATRRISNYDKIRDVDRSTIKGYKVIKCSRRDSSLLLL